ncbi:MAG: AraC family transcriptional regulator [Alphaproteobacteria bacterium]|nr:AraC family transcriptional regulator [Alphaproteobacteria bacterium]MBV8413522.1 AraC family transcriptional regulator [Alphaproteobacteria bacterium]
MPEISPIAPRGAPSAEEGRLVTVSTDGVAPCEQLGFWRDVVLNRNRPLVPQDKRPFQARLTRIVLSETELVEHVSDAVESDRSPGRSQFAGGDDIAIELMRKCRGVFMEHNGEQRLRSGDMYIVDYAQPLHMKRMRHRACGIVLSRRRVIEAIGGDPAQLAGVRLPARGLGALLRAHLQATLDEARHMTAAQRALAGSAAADMALALLQATAQGRIDGERLSGGLHEAARRLIARRCCDSAFGPEQVVQAMGCSRATLYRTFALHDESVAAVIWEARLELAHRLLGSAQGLGMSISELALAAGFREVTTFSHMFRRRFGMAPGEARERMRESNAASAGLRLND